MLKNTIKTALKYFSVGYLGFQLGLNAYRLDLEQNYVSIPKPLVEKYGSNFRELVADVVSMKDSDSLEDIVFHSLIIGAGKLSEMNEEGNLPKIRGYRPNRESKIDPAFYQNQNKNETY